MSVQRAALQWRLAFSSSPALPILRRTLLRPRRVQARYGSTKPLPSTPKIPITTTANASIPPKTQTRVDGILRRTQRFLPKRFHGPLQNFRAAPYSHIISFLLIHEITAILPIFALVSLFQYYDIVPVEYVFGPWAGFAQAGAAKFLNYFKRKGWFGLGDEGAREGEMRFEGDLKREAGKEVDKKNNRILGWFRKGRKEEGEDDEAVEQAKSKTRKAVDLVREKVTLRNTESGYKIGVQLVAAYAITKVLLIPRIAFSIWVTPSVARAMIWGRKAIFKR
ncbi:hypothetical protein BJ170DRAFT_686310 [Xylariales sp. AK1849]|nr:hypothetical protein BJ170DRAFT_686310 [Xylariales sp. AK1849]